MPYSEPNSFGEMTAEEWRATYDEHANEFKKSDKGPGEELALRIRLRQLGYAGANLDAEVRHLKA